MARQKRSWFERFRYWLGYGDEPLPPEEEVPKSHVQIIAVNITEPSVKSLLTDFVNAVLNGGHINISVATPPLQGRFWWSDTDVPTLKEPDVDKGWESLMAAGRACELLTWAEASILPSLTNIFAETLLKFQYEETLITEDDACPLPWGALAYQAAVAAYNAAWLAVARSAGATDSQVQVTREQLRLWLASAADMGTVRSGDVVLLYQFYNGFVRWRPTLAGNVENAQEVYKKAQDKVQKARSEQERAHWRRARCAARSRVTQARIVERQAKTDLNHANAAISELDDALNRWHALSPLTRLLETAPPRKTDSVTPLPLSGLVVDPHAEGIQQWLIRQMVRRCPLSVVASEAANEALRIFQTITLDENSPPTDDTWRARLFLWRFYRLWVLSCPTMEEVQRSLPTVTDQQRAQFKAFLAPFEQLQKAHRELGGQRFLADDVRRRFQDEYARLRDYLEQPERWQNRLLTTAEDKMQALQDHLFGVLRVHVQTVQQEDDNDAR